VQDANGDPLAGVTCGLEITQQPGTTTTLDDTQATTGETGSATATLNVGETDGTIKVEATCNGVTGTLTLAAEAAAAPPASLPDTGAGGIFGLPGGSGGSAAVLLGASGAMLLAAGAQMQRQRRRGESYIPRMRPWP
jgi:hypothetical protein